MNGTYNKKLFAQALLICALVLQELQNSTEFTADSAIELIEVCAEGDAQLASCAMFMMAEIL